jgi:hypothetical protein
MKYEFGKAQRQKVKGKLEDPEKTKLAEETCKARKIREALSERGEAPGLMSDPILGEDVSHIMEKVKDKYPNKKSPKISITIAID